MYFLALSQAPPVLEKLMASWIPEAMHPAIKPLTPLAPKKKPKKRGERMTRSPGGTIILMEELVEI
jgi:hypothetical protein